MSATPRYLLIATGDGIDHCLMATWAALGIAAFGQGAVARIVTDHPQRFAWLGDTVELRAVDADQVRTWRGPKDFVFRTKLEAIRDAAGVIGDAPLIYTDGDVAARGDLAPLHAELTAGRAAMHLFESALGGRKSWRKRMLRAVDGRMWEGLTFSGESPMWNAGVIAIPGGHVQAVAEQALATLDAMHADGVEDYLLEQLIVSATMTTRFAPLQAADPWLAHYWGNKPHWVDAIARRVAGWQLAETPVADAVAELAAKPIALATVVRDRRVHRLLPPALFGDRLKTEFHKSF